MNDPEKREIYDQYGEDALKEGMGGGGGGGHNPFDIFESFFGGNPFGGMHLILSMSFNLPGYSQSEKNIIFEFHLLWLPGGGSSRGRRQRRGEDVVHPLKVSLDDLYNGTSKKLSLSRNVLCPKCKG